VPLYFEEDDWIPVPDNWNRNIVQGKIYDTKEYYGKLLYQQLQEVLHKQRFNENLLREDPNNGRYGKKQKIKPRIGQGAFKVLITDAYYRRCAITGEKTLPVLEAAHIKLYSLNGPHEINNGLLLRRDFHTLFDRGYITINKEFNVEVSRRIKEDFGNGKEYYAHHGSKLIILPERREQLLDPHYLEWYNENAYLG
jgi:putative restriction endonuclease